jgi:hypothetical protein
MLPSGERVFPLKQVKKTSAVNDSGLGPEDVNSSSMARQVISVRRTGAKTVFGTETRFKGSKASIAIHQEEEMRAKGLMKPLPPATRHETDEIVQCITVGRASSRQSGGSSVHSSSCRFMSLHHAASSCCFFMPLPHVASSHCAPFAPHYSLSICALFTENDQI